MARARTDSNPHSWLGALVLAVVAFGAAPAVRAQQPSVATEYEVKAAYVFNFANFVTWPASAFASPTSPVVIGVAGDSPLEEPLVRAIQGETINGRPLVVRRVAHADDMKACHVLVSGANESKQMARSLAELRNSPVLTISDAEDFLNSGGMVRLVVTSNNKVGFDVNVDTMSRAGLKPNARLLKVARRVFGNIGGT